MTASAPAKQALIRRLREKWLQSGDGVRCTAGHAYGHYLRHRIVKAFDAGFRNGIQAAEQE